VSGGHGPRLRSRPSLLRLAVPLASTTDVRHFVVPTLPTLFWLYEKRVSVTFWDLGAGWSLALERSLSGPGPGSTVHIVGPDRSTGDAGLRWVPAGRTTDTGEPSSDAGLDGLLASGTGRTVDKTRRGAMVDTVWWELEEYHGRNAGLVTARRGLEGLVVPRQVPLPDWVGAEATADPRLGDDRLAGPPLAG
jgi:hypothetical protein